MDLQWEILLQKSLARLCGQKKHQGASTQTDIVEYFQEKQPEMYLQNNGRDIGKRSWGHWWHFSKIIRIWWVVIKIYCEGMDKVTMEFLLNTSLKWEGSNTEGSYSGLSNRQKKVIFVKPWSSGMCFHAGCGARECHPVYKELWLTHTEWSINGH